MQHPAIIACLDRVSSNAQPRARGQITPSAGSAQVLGAASKRAPTLLLVASCTEDGEAVSMAPKISPQTAMQAMNRPRNINVSNFMIMSPMKGESPVPRRQQTACQSEQSTQVIDFQSQKK
jgi:hypothetical protein